MIFINYCNFLVFKKSYKFSLNQQLTYQKSTFYCTYVRCVKNNVYLRRKRGYFLIFVLVEFTVSYLIYF